MLRWIFLVLVLSCGAARAQAPALPSSAAQSTFESTLGAATLTPESLALKARVQQLEAQIAAGAAPADAQNLALLRFKLEQAHLWLNQLETNTADSVETANYWLSVIVERAEIVAQARGDAAFPALAQPHEHAYLAANDNSPQPYWMWVPDNYSPRRKYPLVIFLHGYSPDITKAWPWLPGEETWKEATRRGFLFAVPYGRRNSDFVDIGEDDTLKVLSEVKRHYAVDESRVFLLGPSMGGYGVYAVGLHHPHLWAGLATMAARSDFYLWFNLQRETVSSWKRLQYDADDPRFLKRNALHLPIFMQHGALDATVPVEHSRRLFSDLHELGFAARYREVADGDHGFYWQAQTYEHALDWMSALRQAPPPRRVWYSSGNLRHNRAYWVEIEAFDDYGRVAHIEAEIKDNNAIEVRTENVAAFALRPPAAYLQPTQPVTLFVNGAPQPHAFDAAQPIRWRAPDKNAAESTFVPFPAVKTVRRSGPIKNCYRDPFLVIYGTQRLVRDINPDEQQARRWVREWQLYADGVPPIKADSTVTTDDLQNYNLILFGTRESNKVLSQIADRLPLELTPSGYRVGNKNIEYNDGLGLQLCYPSPFDARRMIVVQSGLYWGSALPINHKFDLLPDYIVFDRTVEASDNTNRAIVAGHFDHAWGLNEAAP